MLVQRSTSLFGATLLAVCLALGCRDTNRGFLETYRGDASVDPRDAGVGGADAGGNRPDGAAVDLDGATTDAAALGLDGSLNLPDGSLITPGRQIVLPDGEVLDLDEAIMRFKPEIDVSTCGVSDEDSWSTPVEFSDEAGFALVPGQVGFALAYQSSADCSHNVALMDISAGGFVEPHDLLPNCHTVSGVAMAVGTSGLQVAWVDNASGSDEVYSSPLDWELKREASDPHTQITKVDQALGRKQKPVVAEVNGRMLAAWITRNAAGTGDIISARVLGPDGGEVVELVGASAGRRPRTMAIASMGAQAAALVWAEPTGQPGIWLLRLDANAAAIDAPILLSDEVAPASTVDVASRPGDGGAAVYSIERDGANLVAFRRLDDLGQTVGEERSIVGSPLRARGASLHALGGGYAVMYRALPGGGISSPEVRLTFVNKDGSVQSDQAGHLLSSPIAPCGDADGRTSVAVSVEGELMVGWTDGIASQKTLKLVRRRLTCQ